MAVVSGRVYREATGEGIKGVLLRLNGLAAITDREGRFTFYLPEAGTRYLRVDASTAGMNLIPAKTMPMPIDAHAGSKVVVDIGDGRGLHGQGKRRRLRVPRGQDRQLGTETARRSRSPSAPGCAGSRESSSSSRTTTGSSGG